MVLAPGGRVVQWSEGAERLLGYPAAEIVGRSAAALAPPGQGAALVRRLRSSHDDPPVRVAAATELRDRDGRAVAVECVVAPTRDAGGRLRSTNVLLRRTGPGTTGGSRREVRRSFLEFMPVAIVGVDAHGLVWLCNAAAAQAFGRPADTLQGQQLPVELAPLLTVAPDAAEVTITRLDGTTAVLRSRSFPVPEVGEVPGGHILMASDITDLRVTQGALATETSRAAAEEARYRLLFAANPLPMWVYDLETLRFLEVNDAAVTRYGYTRDEFLHMRITDIRPEADVATLIEHVHADRPALQDSGPWRHRRKDGTLLYVEVVSHTLEFVGRPAVMVVAHDVSARLSAEAERDRLAAAVEQSIDSIVMFDLDNRITYMNAAVERSTGFSRAELLGQPAAALAGGAPIEVEPEIDAARAAGRTWAGAVTGRRRDGTTSQVEITVSPVRDSAGRLMGSVSVGRDVTRERALEEQLRQAQKMEAVGRLAGGIAHDFNNLLTIVSGNTQLLLDEVADGPAREEALEISGAADRAASLTRQLLAFSRKQVLAPEVLSLGAVVGELGPLVRRLVGEDIATTVRVDDAGRAIQADRSQIEQVVMNLVVNARDAMPQGGSLALAVSPVDLDASYAAGHAGVAPGPHVQLSVSDTGLGMDDETREHAFEPFFTTKQPGTGTGLGLSMVDGIVRQLGGHIWLYSERGMGTTFKLYFPAIPREASAPLMPVLAPEPAAAAFRTILLVEDEQGVRNLARRFLASAGYAVLAASGPAEALDLIRAHATSIDVLLTDIVMPGGGGPQVATELLAVNPTARVVYMSGYSEDTISHHGVLDPGTALLHKPFNRDGLLQTVRLALSGPAAPGPGGARGNGSDT